MTIKEVEELLSVSRSNIRFYEKEGLLNPERKGNNYRDYSEQDIAVLKKILVLRKLGFTVEEISLMQKGELPLADAAYENINRLEKELDSLKGALEITKSLSADKFSYETLNQERLWDEISHSERNGQKFVDICKDYFMFEQIIFENVWKYVFFHDFKKSRNRHGTLIALGILLFICIVRGIARVVIWHESFWEGFLYPIILFTIASITFLPIYMLGKKAPRVAYVVNTILLTVAIIFLSLCVLLILYGIVRAIFS
ncbi:MAG: MerR family transcriptional regulator [Candidatus Fimenecus sp.]